MEKTTGSLKQMCTSQELFIQVKMKSSGGSNDSVAKWGLRSRAVSPSSKKDKIKWHERLVMELPKSKLCVERDGRQN